MEKKTSITVVIAAGVGFAVGRYWPKLKEKALQLKDQVAEAKEAATKAVAEAAEKAEEGKTEEK